MRHQVGRIEEHDVIFVPEKDIVFCKNTAIPYNKLKEALFSSIDKIELTSDLTMKKELGLIQLGCLTTTIENCKEINLNIKKVRHGKNIN